MATFWREDGTWGCDRHWVSKFPASIKFCYYSDCAKMCSGRPDLKKRCSTKTSDPKQKVKPNKDAVIQVLKMKGTRPCFFDGCDKMNREGSKYCSDSCRIANAHKRYAERQRSKNEQRRKSDSGRD